MQYPTRRQKIILALGLYLAVVLLSVYIHILKRDALQFHQRDYNYFVEQAARLTDPKLAKSFAMQIEGYNFLGLQGVEGVKSLFHAIHTSYFRYVYVLLYSAFRDPVALYFLYSLVFFLPILYFAVMPHPDNRQHAILLLLFSFLYLVFPATLNSATADLRPRVLFAPAWCLVILSVYFNRPFWEKAIFFLLLVGLREEGIILGAIVIVLNHLKMAGQPGRRVQTISFTVIDITAFLLFLVFMRWGEFTRVDDAYNPLNFIRLIPVAYWIIALVVGALVIYYLWLAWKRKSEHHRMMVFLGVYALAVLLAGFQWLRDTLRWYTTQSLSSPVSFYDLYLSATTNEMTALVFYMLIVLAVIFWDYWRGFPRKRVTIAYSVLIVVFTFSTILYYSPLLSAWIDHVPPARLVWDFAANHDRYATKVLLDYDTYQAFYNYDQVIVYNRLPVWDALPEKRYYPENKNALVTQIEKGIDYAVISRGSLENVLELAEMAGIPVSEVAANERYVILKFHFRTI